MINRRRLSLVLLSLSLVLASCSKGGTQEAHFSTQGFIPEAYIPADIGLLLSYSTRDDAQYAAVQALEVALGDEGRLSETASQTLDTGLGWEGLDFEEDLKPVFGEQFHMVYGLRPVEGGEAESFTVVTLEDSEKMTALLESFVSTEELSYKKLSEIDAFVREEDKLFMTVHEDLLFVSNTGENLVAMTEQKKSESLWGSDLYQDTVERVGSDFVLYGVMFPASYGEELSSLAGFSVGSIPAVVDQQVVVVRAEEEGLRFEAWMDANKEKAKEAGISFDSVPRSEPYLFEKIPAAGLVGYFESFGLAQTFAQAEALGDSTGSLEQLKTVTRNYFGMDFEDLMSFMDKGYSFAIHRNANTWIPGLSIIVDISSNPDKAEDFVNKLDGQLSGLLLIAEQALPGAITKDTISWAGEEFAHINLDLSALPQSAESPLPALGTGALELVYGISDGRLIISTLTAWDETGEFVKDSELYKNLSGQVTEQNEGLVLVSAQELAEMVRGFRALQTEELTGELTEEVTQLEDFLEGFLGMIAQSKTEAYESRFGGFLMLAD
jgi:hypothetical protein